MEKRENVFGSFYSLSGTMILGTIFVSSLCLIDKIFPESKSKNLERKTIESVTPSSISKINNYEFNYLNYRFFSEPITESSDGTNYILVPRR